MGLEMNDSRSFQIPSGPVPDAPEAMRKNKCPENDNAS